MGRVGRGGRGPRRADERVAPAQADAATSVTAVLTDREPEVAINTVNYTYDSPDQPWLDLYFNAYQSAQTIREKRIGTNGRLDIIDFDTDGVELRNTADFGARDASTSQAFSWVEV